MLRRVLFGTACLLLVLAALAAAPILAEPPTPNRPVRVSNYVGTVWEGGSLALGVEASGRVHVLWTGERAGEAEFSVFYATSPDGQTWAPYQVLHTGMDFDPRLAVDDARGRVHIVYRSNGPGIVHRVLDHGVMLSETIVDTGSVVRPELAVDPTDGALSILWQRVYTVTEGNTTDFRHRSYLARWRGGTWSAPQQVGDASVDGACYDLAADAAGGLMLACNSSGVRLRSQYAADGVHFGPSQYVNAGYPWPERDGLAGLDYVAAEGRFHILVTHDYWPGMSDIYRFVYDGGIWRGPWNVTLGSSSRWSARGDLLSGPRLPGLFYGWMEFPPFPEDTWATRSEQRGILGPIEDVGAYLRAVGSGAWSGGSQAQYLGADGTPHLAFGETAYDAQGRLYYMRLSPPPPLVTATITAAAGGVLTLPHGAGTVTFPPNAVTQTATISYLVAPSATAALLYTGTVTHLYTLAAQRADGSFLARLARPYTVTLAVDPAHLPIGPVRLQTMRVLSHTLTDDLGATWVVWPYGVGGGVDLGRQRLTYTTPNLGAFAVSVEPTLINTLIVTGPVLASMEGSATFTATVGPANATLPAHYFTLLDGYWGTGMGATHAYGGLSTSVTYRNWAFSGWHQFELRANNGGASLTSPLRFLNVVHGRITPVTPAGGRFVLTQTAQTGVEVLLPAGSFTRNMNLVYRAKAPRTAAGLRYAGRAFSLLPYPDGYATYDLAFPAPATLVLHYSHADVAGLDEESLVLYSAPDDGNIYTPAACGAYVRHPETNYLEVPICHLSDSVLLGAPGQLKLSLPLVMK